MELKRLRLSILPALAALLWSVPGPAQNLDFPHGLGSAASLYPTQQSVMNQLTLQVKSIVNNGTQPILSCAANGGYTGDDVADGEWGTVALLAFWWYQNNGSAAGFNSLTQSGKAAITAASYQTFAQSEINYALGVTGGNPCDLSDSGQATGGSSYLLAANGYLYSKYLPTDTVVGEANYEETALSLIYKDMIYQYNTAPAGASLLTSSQLASVMSSAQSNWSWLTIDAVFDPEHTANQVMQAVLGGYWLGYVMGLDTAQFSQSAATAQMSAALDYYDGGLANSNQTTGFRQIEIATNSQGYKYFTEHFLCMLPTTPTTRVYDQASCTASNGKAQLDGFDTHYSGLQLTHMVQLIYMMNLAQAKYPSLCNTNNGPSCINSNVYPDALAEAEYSRDRLSQAGTMHGGSRHNEMGSTSTDMTFSAGYNYFGQILGEDFGRSLVRLNDSSNGAGSADAWGHRSAELIFLYLNYQPWIAAPLTVNSLAGMRRNSVSVTFDASNQPQEISVGGTVLTDAIHNSVVGSDGGADTQSEQLGVNGKAQGLEIVDASGNVTTPAAMSQPVYDSTTNYTLRSVTGTATIPGGSANLRQYYLTDGTSLYIVSLAQLPSGSASLTSVGSLLGMPNISTENRIVDVCPISATPCGSSSSTVVLDLSAGTTGSFGGSYSSVTGIQTGGVAMYAWPQIVAENAAPSPTGYTWRSPAGYPTAYTTTLEDLSDATPHIFYYPNSISAIITNSGEIRTQMQPTSGPTAYKPGDSIASVVRIAPTSFGNTMTVTAHYAAGSAYNLASCAASPCLDVEDTGLSFTVSSSGVATFADKASSQTIVSPELGTPALTAQTITFNNPGAQTVGTPLALTATATSGLTVSFASTTASVCTVNGTTATFIAAGTCSITASQAGNSTYAAATPVSQSFTVNAASLTAQTISFANPGAQTVGTPLALTATATSGLTVSFASTTASVCTVNGATATFIAAGTCSITASQAGNSTYGAATPVSQSFTVSTALTAQTITFNNPGAQTVSTPLALSATASSGLAVSFASTTTSVCTVSGTTASFIAAGTCSITASQAGNSTYAAATPVSQTFTVSTALIAQTITFNNPGAQTVGTPLNLTATATSGLAVSFASTTASVCTVSGATASFIAAGTCSITASQAGNSTYAAAAPVSQSFTVNAAIVPSFTVGGTAVTIAAPGATTGNTSTITVTPSGGFTGSVTLTAAIAGGPSNASADEPLLSFGSTSPVTLSSAAAGTATLTISTVAATSATLARPMRPWRGSGTALACILLFGLFARRRWPASLGLLVFVALLAGGVSGCGSGSSGAGGGGGGGGGGNPGTATGLYQVTVTATSGSATAQTTFNVQLN
ncbi:MAG: hypothetical protein ABR924_03785 [Terracidiphilus sp.]